MTDRTASLLLDTRAIIGEGPHWDAGQGCLWWVDILGSCLHRFDPASGRDVVFPVGDHVGTVVPRASGGVMLALRRGFASFMPGVDARPTLVREPADHPSGNRFNDGACDPAGRLWAGTMAYDETPGAGALYRLDAGHRVERLIGGVTISNGLVWDAQRGLFHYIDSPTRCVRTFDYDPASGGIGRPRVTVRCAVDDGFPDGMALDAEGKLWIAHWGGSQVVRWDPSTGLAIQRIRLPVAQPSACAFGGERLDRLYITSARVGLSEAVLAREPAGGLFVADPGVTGFASTPFAG